VVVSSHRHSTSFLTHQIFCRCLAIRIQSFDVVPSLPPSYFTTCIMTYRPIISFQVQRILYLHFRPSCIIILVEGFPLHFSVVIHLFMTRLMIVVLSLKITRPRVLFNMSAFSSWAHCCPLLMIQGMYWPDIPTTSRLRYSNIQRRRWPAKLPGTFGNAKTCQDFPRGWNSSKRNQPILKRERRGHLSFPHLYVRSVRFSLAVLQLLVAL